MLQEAFASEEHLWDGKELGDSSRAAPDTHVARVKYYTIKTWT